MRWGKVDAICITILCSGCDASVRPDPRSAGVQVCPKHTAASPQRTAHHLPHPQPALTREQHMDQQQAWAQVHTATDASRLFPSACLKTQPPLAPAPNESPPLMPYILDCIYTTTTPTAILESQGSQSASRAHRPTLSLEFMIAASSGSSRSTRALQPRIGQRTPTPCAAAPSTSLLMRARHWTSTRWRSAWFFWGLVGGREVCVCVRRVGVAGVRVWFRRRREGSLCVGKDMLAGGDKSSRQ